MTNHELERARAELSRLGADWALLTTPENVTYVSHFDVPLPFGALHALSYAPVMALVGVREPYSALLTGSFLTGLAAEQSALDDVVSHDVFGHFDPVAAADNFTRSVRTCLERTGLQMGRGKLAVEERTLPMLILRQLQVDLPNIEFIDAGPALDAARKIKTAREIGLLREAAEVNRTGHEALLAATREAGKNEFELWSIVMNAMEMKAGKTLNVFGEIVTGTRVRQVVYPGGPKDRVTQPGDSCLMDMSPRVNGYWSDATNTMVVGGVDPTPKQRRYGVASRDAFYAAAETLRPGRHAREAFEAAKAVFEKHGLEIGHYVGHQIGCQVNEMPRLVPYDNTVIQANMVFSIECGSYEGPDGEVGARMEKSVIVHDSGPEVICDFPWGF